MKPSAPSLIALVVAVFALVVGVFRRAESSAREPEPAPAVDGDAVALADRLTKVEIELARLGEEVALLRLTSSGTREVVSSEAGNDASLADRLAEVERQLAKPRDVPPPAMHAHIDAATNEARRAASRRAQDRAKPVEQWVRLAQDPGASEDERLNALRMLRGSRLPDGTDARLGVLPEMILLAENSQNPRARADVWRQLSRVGDPSLVPALLNALHHDASAEVREEAAETLGDYLSHPGVQAALQFAAGNDASFEVRAQANESLARR